MTTAVQTGSLLLEIPYRTDTASYVERLLDLPGCIFFDSGHPDAERGRYDIFSASPLYTLSYKQGTLTRPGFPPQTLSGTELTTKLNQLLKEQQAIQTQTSPDPASHNATSPPQLPFYGGFAGYFSYDLARQWEKLPEIADRDIDMPELVLGFYPWAAVIDHQLKSAWLSILPNCPESLKQQLWTLLGSSENKKKYDSKFKLISKLTNTVNVNYYMDCIAKIQQYIINGDCYQVNYTQRFKGAFRGQPWAAYKKLRSGMAAPFGAYFHFHSSELSEDIAILSYSPERFIKVSNKSLLTQPIKGTIKRHQDPTQDKQNIEKLQNSEKDRAENLMIVDLLRNDLGKCCVYGSVKVEKLFELQSVKNVHHLVSSVTGRLQDHLTAFDLLQATLPGGSITGAPKLRSMEIIEELEPTRRSIYCGVLGYININGDMDSNIAIRTVLCVGGTNENPGSKPGDIYCWGGGGIVADSHWQQEYDESLLKVDALLKDLESMS